MKILITRPEPEASELAELLSSHETIILPLLEIKMLNMQSLPDPRNELIFVSKNAVAGFAGISPEQPCFAVGASTAAALKQKGFNKVTYPKAQEGSEALLALPELSNVKNRNFTIVCGVDSREHLEKTLKSHGAGVSHLITYQTHFRKLAPSELSSLNIAFDLVIVTSNHALRHLAKLARAEASHLLTTPVTVLKGNMLESATRLGFEKPLIIDSFANEQLRHLPANHHFS